MNKIKIGLISAVTVLCAVLAFQKWKPAPTSSSELLVDTIYRGDSANPYRADSSEIDVPWDTVVQPRESVVGLWRGVLGNDSVKLCINGNSWFDKRTKTEGWNYFGGWFTIGEHTLHTFSCDSALNRLMGTMNDSTVWDISSRNEDTIRGTAGRRTFTLVRTPFDSDSNTVNAPCACDSFNREREKLFTVKAEKETLSNGFTGYHRKVFTNSTYSCDIIVFDTLLPYTQKLNRLLESYNRKTFESHLEFRRDCLYFRGDDGGMSVRQSITAWTDRYLTITIHTESERDYSELHVIDLKTVTAVQPSEWFADGENGDTLPELCIEKLEQAGFNFDEGHEGFEYFPSAKGVTLRMYQKPEYTDAELSYEEIKPYLTAKGVSALKKL